MTVPDCRTFVIDGLTGNAITIPENEPDQYFAYSYWGDRYWGGLYFGVGRGAISVTTPTERTFTIPAESRTYTIPSDGSGNEVTTVAGSDAGVPLGFALLYLYSGVSSITVTGTPDDRTYTIPACST